MATTQSPIFSEFLRRSRRALGLTQEELAERAGVSARLISSLESDVSRRPRKDTLRLLAQALELSSEDGAAFTAAARQPSPAPVEEAAKDQGERTSLPRSPIQTFLVADIRGYSRFTQDRGDEAAARLAVRFVQLAEEVVRPWEGRVIETRGDEVLVAFSSARGALQAAVALQAQLETARAADSSLALEVGIGLDAGEAVPVGEGYRGGALNLAARLCSLAAGGEVFASEGVVHLARKTEGLVVADRGAVSFKGLTEPVRVIQLAREGTLSEDLPPLQATPVTHPTNLPDEPNPFIGREQEVVALTDLLGQPAVRQVTLTGTGGVGKTRLALRAGGALLDAFRDGVFFVSLAALTDPALVPSAIADVLGAQEGGETDLLTTLISSLKEKHLLLILDNYEHLLDAATVVSSLLDACRELHILVTSRTPLHLLREHEYPVPPLTVPTSGQNLDPGHPSQYDAVALFVERARAVRPDFHVTDKNAPAIAEICCRLDGLPLAIELAATRIRLFPPQALLQRLSHRLSLLSDRAADRPARHQTLRATIDWSYSLLCEQEQTLFARLSVFAGGCTLEAAEAVCSADGKLDVLEGIAALVDKSLLRQIGQEEPRFRMLETIQEYARERLEASEEAEDTARHHARYFCAISEQAQAQLTGPEQVRWLHLLDTEHTNIRAALSFFRHTSNIRIGLRMAAGLWRFWYVRGYLSEGRAWLDFFLAGEPRDAGQVHAMTRAQALNGAGSLAYAQNDMQRAIVLYEESLTLRRDINDLEGIAASLSNLGTVMLSQGHYERAAALTEESVSLNRRLGNPWRIAASLNNSGEVARAQRKYGRATALYEECLSLCREIGDTQGITIALSNLGSVARGQGAYARAVALHQESLALCRQLGDTWGIATALRCLGTVMREQGYSARAVASYIESLALYRQLGDEQRVAECLEGMAGAACDQGQMDTAAQVYGAAAALRRVLGTPMPPDQETLYERDVARVRDALGEVALEGLAAKGALLTVDRAVGMVRAAVGIAG